MSGGSVPGSGHHDTVPRTLDAGAFVIRKAAVQKYGGGALSRLANGVAHFAAAARWRCSAAARRGCRPERQAERAQKNREAVER
jgi:hypothetical protein